MGIAPSAKAVVHHRAGWLAVDPWTIYQDGCISISDDRIVEAGKFNPRRHTPFIDHGAGVIIPGLVNAHTHLELCALAGKVSYANGFTHWVETLLSQRSLLSSTDILNAAAEGIDRLKTSGCHIIGEISTLGVTRQLMAAKRMAGMWFHEYVGSMADQPLTATGMSAPFQGCALAGHAPHSTSPETLMRLKTATRKKNLPFSIHVAESEPEMAFLQTATGPWAEFLSSRGIDFSTWGLPQKSAVGYLDQLGVLDEYTLAVHLLFCSADDIDVLLNRRVHVCLCPRSNKNLHDRLPDIPLLLAKGIKPGLGSDSLASVRSLSIVDEMRFIAENFPEVSPVAIFEMGTINGAAGLALEHVCGTLAPGKMGAFHYMPVAAGDENGLMERIVWEGVL